MDLNGRTGLEAHDILIQYDLAGNIVSNTDNLSIDNARRNDTAGFVQVDLAPASKFTVSGGLRGDYVSNVNEGGYFGDREVTNGAFSGYAAIAYGPVSNLTFTAQVSRGFRDPTLSDRFFRGPERPRLHHGQSRSRAGDQPAVGFRRAVYEGPLSAAAYTYCYRIDNLIERYPPATDFFEFRNRGRAGIKGFETELQADLGTRTLAGGRRADRPRRAAGRRRQSRRHLAGPDVGDRCARRSTRGCRRSSGWRSTPKTIGRVRARSWRPGHTNLDLGATWAPIKHIEIRGAIRNLLDEEYYASPDPRFVAAPGINGFVTVRVKF